MGIKLDNNVYAFLLIVIGLFLVTLLLRAKSNKALWVITQIMIGGIIIFIFNLIGNNFNVTLPLNPLSIILAGIFQIPGIAFLLIIKYIIYS